MLAADQQIELSDATGTQGQTFNPTIRRKVSLVHFSAGWDMTESN